MASSLNKVKIALRTDDLSNWTNLNPILKEGEIAIVVDSEGNENLKIGNGLSAFNDLKYLNQNVTKTDKVQSKEIETKSFSQGYNVKSTPTSLATGVFSEANGNFGVVHGIEARILSSDDYAFVFNGQNLDSVTDRYTSHGDGTFNINPTNGLQGFYIGETSFHDILDSMSASCGEKISALSDVISALDNQKISHGKVGASNNFGQYDSPFTTILSLDNDIVYVPRNGEGTESIYYIMCQSSLGNSEIPPISDRYWSANGKNAFYIRYGQENPYVHGEFHIYEPTLEDPLVFQITTTEDSPVQLTADILYGQNLTFNDLYYCENHKYSWSIPFGEQILTCSIQLIPYYDAHAYPREYLDTIHEKLSNEIENGQVKTLSVIEQSYVKLSSETTQQLSTNLNVEGFIRVGGITAQGRKFNEITQSLCPLSSQSRTCIGQTYLMISTDFINKYIQGHTYLLTTDISNNMIYKDITDLNEMSVTYHEYNQDLSFDSHVGSAVYNEEEQDLELQILRM